MESRERKDAASLGAEGEHAIALQQVVLDLTSTLDLDAVLTRVAEIATRLFGASDAHIFLYDSDRDELSLVAGHWADGRPEPPPAPRREGVTFSVVHSGQPAFIERGATNPAFSGVPDYRVPAAFASIPLIKGRRVLGAINLGFPRPRVLDAETRVRLDLVARHAALAIDNAQLYGAATARAGQLAALYEISLGIGGQLDLHKLLDELVRKSCELLQADGAYLFSFDSRRNKLTLIAQTGMDVKYMQRELALGEGMSGRVARERRGMAVDDYRSWPERADPFTDVPFAATVAAPLLWQGQLLGTFGVYMLPGRDRRFGAEDVRLVEQLAAQAAIAIQNAQLYSSSRRHESELARRVQELALVNDISQRVNRLDWNQVQHSSLEQIMERFRPAYAALGTYDPLAETVTITAVRPVGDPFLGRILRVENNPDLARARELRRAIVWRDDSDMPSSHPTRVYLRSRGTSQLVLAPLVVQQRVIGFLGIDPGARELREDDVSLIQTVANQIAIAMENARLYELALDKARIERELQLARSVQAGLIGHERPHLPGWNLAARWEPAHEVSGDFYDFISLPDGRLGLVIGDVTGKGMASALVMATTRAVLRAAAWDGQNPAHVLARVNDILCQDMPPRMFVTCFYGILNPFTGEILFANAGQNLPLRKRTTVVERLVATGFPLGLMPELTYEESRASIIPGESLFFYSDGLVEAHDQSGEMLGMSRLVELLSAIDDPGQLVPRALERLAEFTGPDWEQEDDVTVLTLTRESSGPI